MMETRCVTLKDFYKRNLKTYVEHGRKNHMNGITHMQRVCGIGYNQACLTIKYGIRNGTLAQDGGNEYWHYICPLIRVLQLTLKNQWFDLIANGEKVFEYREYKQYWMSRLLCKSGIRTYDEIRFTNGYGIDKPFIRAGFGGAAILRGENCHPKNGEHLGLEQKYFVIGIGEILETGVSL